MQIGSSHESNSLRHYICTAYDSIGQDGVINKCLVQLQITYANASFSGLVGVPADQLIKMRLHEVSPSCVGICCKAKSPVGAVFVLQGKMPASCVTF